MAASGTLAELDELKAKAQETRELLRDIRREITEISLESNAPARVKLASQPNAPSYPDSGRRLQLAVLAVLASCSAGLAAGVWRELTDQETRSTQDITAITNLPVLAAIPHVDEDRFLDSIEAPLLTADFPYSPTADEFRRILARIIYPPESSVEVNSCLVASPTRGDGKTTVACNLAIALAQAERTVLLVDICPRDPSVERCFGLDPGPGLAEALYDEEPVAMLARGTDLPNLSVLGPGLRSGEVTGKLASRDMARFLESAEQCFDHVVIDTPPSLLMSDAKLLAPVVDGVVVVVGIGVSTLGMVRRCLREMEQVGERHYRRRPQRHPSTRGGYLRRNVDMYYNYPKDRGRAFEGGSHPVTAPVGEAGPEVDPPIILLADDENPPPPNDVT